MTLDRTVVRVMVYQIKLIDRDNLVASIKCLLDSLKVRGGLGLIRDEDPEHLHLVDEQTRVGSRAEERVEIEVGAWLAEEAALRAASFVRSGDEEFPNRA